MTGHRSKKQVRRSRRRTRKKSKPRRRGHRRYHLLDCYLRPRKRIQDYLQEEDQSRDDAWDTGVILSLARDPAMSTSEEVTTSTTITRDRQQRLRTQIDAFEERFADGAASVSQPCDLQVDASVVVNNISPEKFLADAVYFRSSWLEYPPAEETAGSRTPPARIAAEDLVAPLE